MHQESEVQERHLTYVALPTETVVDPAFVILDNGKLLEWNRAFQHHVRYAYQELRDKHSTDFFSGADKALFQAWLKVCIERGSRPLELLLRSADGVKTRCVLEGLRCRYGENTCLVIIASPKDQMPACRG